MQEAEIAVVGGGIVGLAFAYAHAKRGRKVVLFERTDFAIGASVRNFGSLWPIGKALGKPHDRAMLSREIWNEIIAQTNLWHAASGSLHLAYADDELAVLDEYLTSLGSDKFGRALISPDAAAEKSHAIVAPGLRGALWSPTEMNIDPREAVRKIPEMLRDKFGVTLCFGTQVLDVSLPKISTSLGDWRVQEAVVCSGADFQTLYPALFREGGMTLCKLQMMRTVPQPNGWALGPTLCAGLTLGHYECFKNCATLKPLLARFEREMPFYIEHGIHLLLTQTALGELTIGDSHHYGSTIEPFDRADVDEAILRYLKTFAQAPTFEIAEHWNGTYPKLPGKTEFIASPAPGVTIANGLGGAGMTLSFGLAEQVVSDAY